MFPSLPFILIEDKEEGFKRLPLNNASEIYYQELGIKDVFWVGKFNDDWQVVYSRTGLVISKGNKEKFQAVRNGFLILSKIKDKWETIKAQNKEKIKQSNSFLYDELF